MIATACGALPSGLLILPQIQELYGGAFEVKGQFWVHFWALHTQVLLQNRDKVDAAQLVVTYLFPPAVPYMSLHAIDKKYSSCVLSDTCDPEQLKLLDMFRSSDVLFLLAASIVQTIFWWILIQMVDIAEDRGNPYRLFQKEEEEIVRIFKYSHVVPY